MPHMTKAPWPNRRLAKRVIRDELLTQFSGKMCWQCGKYLGSMLYLDFGGKVEIPSRRTATVIQGEGVISVRDCYWILHHKEKVIVDSESITDGNAVGHLQYVAGKYLVDFTTSNDGFVEFHFSENVILSLDATNRNDSESNVVEIFMPDGKIFSITPKGYFYLLDEVSQIRKDFLKEKS